MRINVLISYEYFTKGVIAFLKTRDPNDYNLMIDSGAFTAFTQNKTIDLERYCAFLHTVKRIVPHARAIQLDVIGEPGKTRQNFEYMVRSGLPDTIPVFTRGQSISDLDRMYAQSDLVMLGGVATGGGRKEYVKHFMEHNRDRPIHLLGFTDLEFIKHYRPYSVDSSAINAAAMFGSIQYPAGSGILKSISKPRFRSRPPQEFIDAVAKLGFDYRYVQRLSKNEAWKNNGRGEDLANPEILSGTSVFMGFCVHLYRASIVERKINTRMYQAIAANWAVPLIFYAQDWLRKQGHL